MIRTLILFVLVIASLSLLGMRRVEPDLIFSHKFHTQEVGAECSSCHDAANSGDASDNLLPSMATCYTCHDESSTDCGYCHGNPENASEVPRITAYIAHFPHDRHAAKDISCTTCHAGVENSDDVSAVHLPDMASCQSCHGNIEQPDYCYVCHGRKEQLVPNDHRLDWRRTHGVLSHTQGQQCKMCHTEQQCLQCHQQDNLDHKVHPLNFINSHGLAAKIKRDNCTTCHEDNQSCQSCHREQLVLPRNHNTAGWSNRSTGGRHARIAKMDLDNCLTCHNERFGEPICADCHQAGK